jgi:hypothetical protein
VRPDWLKELVCSITAERPSGPDTYACTTDDTALPLFYEWFVKAETYSCSIIIPALTSYLPFGSIFVGPAIAAAAGVGLDFIQRQINAFGGDPAQSPNPELVRELSARYLLSPQGLLTLYRTLAALPGINTHGLYHEEHGDFGGAPVSRSPATSSPRSDADRDRRKSVLARVDQLRVMAVGSQLRTRE